MVPLPQRCTESLKSQMEKALLIHQRDLNAGFGDVYLPYAISEKYQAASRESGWQDVFRLAN